MKRDGWLLPVCWKQICSSCHKTGLFLWSLLDLWSKMTPSGTSWFLIQPTLANSLAYLGLLSFGYCLKKSWDPCLLITAILIPAPVPVHSPQRSTRNHALLEAAGPSHVAINAISANMDSFSSSRTAALKKQPSHMEAAHFGDLGKASSAL